MTRLSRAPFMLLAGGALALIAACSSDHTPTAPAAPASDDLQAGVPLGWSGNPGPSYQIGLDRTNRHGGAAAAYITAAVPSPSTPALMSQGIRADAFRGKRLRWSAWVRHSNIAGGDVGLLMYVEGPGQIPAYDDMSSRSLSGTSDWHQVSVVLDVPSNAIGIQLGVVMSGTGTLLFDDLRLETVGSDVPTTNMLTTPSLGLDSAAQAGFYSLAAGILVNLDFEGLGPTPQQAVDWLGRTVSVLTTTDPQVSLADLDPLGAMIGSAHLVGLGEGTHGTREFFQMKHRILELLVRQKGFTRFAIEANSPEANDMNRYVLTGEGDPTVLLSRLYKWPWNTQEVLDMVLWMRQWNSTAAPSQKVQFLGFDMQEPGASMDSVQAFVSRVDSSNASFVQSRYACLAPYRNHGGTTGLSTTNFAALTAASKAACAGGLQEVFDLFSSHSANYQSASSAATFQLRLHDARLVQQFEAMASIASDRNASIFSRDKSMAENVEWLRDQAGSDARIVLWAHNQHINSVPHFMGGYLRAAYGSDYVNLGFLFGHGGFNAKGANGEGLMAWTVTQIPANSIEAIFAGTGKQEALFDTRQIAAGGSAATALRGPIAMRNIGAVFDPTIETTYFSFPDNFDLLIYLDATTPSHLLPSVYN